MDSLSTRALPTEIAATVAEVEEEHAKFHKAEAGDITADITYYCGSCDRLIAIVKQLQADFSESQKKPDPAWAQSYDAMARRRGKVQ